MSNKTRGSEKMLFACEKNGKRSLADFENVEEALQASGGVKFIPWWWRGMPGPEVLQNMNQLQNFKHVMRR